MKKGILGLAVAGAFAAAYVTANSYATDEAQQTVDAYITEGGVPITYDDISANIFGTVSLSNINMLNLVTIEQLEMQTDSLQENSFEHLYVKAQGIKLAQQLLSDAPRSVTDHLALAFLGAPEGADFVIEVNVDKDADKLVLEQMTFDAEESAHLSLTAEVEDIVLLLESVADKSAGAMAQGLPESTVSQFEFTLEDKGAVDALLSHQVNQSARFRDIDAAREALIDNIEAVNVADLNTMQAKAPLIALLNGGGFTLSLDSPVSLNLVQVFAGQRRAQVAALQKLKNADVHVKTF